MAAEDSAELQLSSAETAELQALEDLIGYKFKNVSLLIRALTHRSSLRRGADGEADYERLEFLGDAVLDLAVGELLLDAYPNANEGELSKYRAALVNTNSLAELSKSVGLVPYIRISKSEQQSGGKERPSLLADVFEAVIGAVYREGGLISAKGVIERAFGDRVLCVQPRDPKTELQEILHALAKAPPRYLLEFTEGPEHAPSFVSAVEVDGHVRGRGRGNTKKASQQAAAEEALRTLKSEAASGKK